MVDHACDTWLWFGWEVEGTIHLSRPIAGYIGQIVLFNFLLLFFNFLFFFLWFFLWFFSQNFNITKIFFLKTSIFRYQVFLRLAPVTFPQFFGLNFGKVFLFVGSSPRFSWKFTHIFYLLYGFCSKSSSHSPSELWREFGDFPCFLRWMLRILAAFSAFSFLGTSFLPHFSLIIFLSFLLYFKDAGPIW